MTARANPIASRKGLSRLSIVLLLGVVILGFAWLGRMMRNLDHDKAAYVDLHGLAARSFTNSGPVLLRGAGSRGHDILVVRTLHPGSGSSEYMLIILDTHGRTDEVRDPDHVLYVGDDSALNLPCGTIDTLAARGVALDANVRIFLERRCQS